MPALNCTDVTVGFPPRARISVRTVDEPGLLRTDLLVDLAATRDGFRQSILDLHQLTTSLKACGTTACGPIKVDATKSRTSVTRGGIFGGMFSAPTRRRGERARRRRRRLVDILENTQQVVGFQCPLVDALIDAGSLTCDGAPCTADDKFNPLAPGGPTGLCLTDAWKTDPGYRQFAVIGRWVLDPADPANFASRLASKKFLIPVDDYEFVPNTRPIPGALAGTPRRRELAAAVTPVVPSTAIAAADDVAVPRLPTGRPVRRRSARNTFAHGSLLSRTERALSRQPEHGVGCDGSLAPAGAADSVFFLLATSTPLGYLAEPSHIVRCSPRRTRRVTGRPADAFNITSTTHSLPSRGHGRQHATLRDLFNVFVSAHRAPMLSGTSLYIAQVYYCTQATPRRTLQRPDEDV